MLLDFEVQKNGRADDLSRIAQGPSWVRATPQPELRPAVKSTRGLRLTKAPEASMTVEQSGLAYKVHAIELRSIKSVSLLLEAVAPQLTPSYTHRLPY